MIDAPISSPGASVPGVAGGSSPDLVLPKHASSVSSVAPEKKLCWLHTDVFHGYSIAEGEDGLLSRDEVPEELVVRLKAVMVEFRAVNSELAKIYNRPRRSA